MRKPDPVALVAGFALAAFGVVLLLDNADVLDLRFAALAPVTCAVVGAILLASGLTRRD
jgi:energy-converting hydrogenase Eha subunit C